MDESVASTCGRRFMFSHRIVPDHERAAKINQKMNCNLSNPRMLMTKQTSNLFSLDYSAFASMV